MVTADRGRDSVMGRREFLATGLALALVPRPFRDGQARGADEDNAEIAAVRQQAERAGLGPIQSRSSKTYLVVGDAPASFLEQALAICEALAKDYLTHFRQREFAVKPPESRLTVVVLSGPSAFASYLGIAPDQAVGGQYDLRSNRLVMFDNRGRADVGPLVERANTVSLMHEAMHQLTYNTGLLDRRVAIPLSFNEGLGTYAETRRPEGRVPIGRPNPGRLLVLVGALRDRHRPIPTAELIADDSLLDPERTAPDLVQRAYARSWLLVYHLLHTPARAAQFRTYLDGLREPRPDHQLTTATFGDLARLDRELRATLRRLVS